MTEIHDLLASDDVDRMLEALEALGVVLERGADAQVLRVHGCAGAFPVKQADLFLGNAGTAFRPLTAALALSGGHYRLSGVPRMHERPIGDLVDALRQAGAQIRYLGRGGLPAAGDPACPDQRGPAAERARRGVQPVPDRPADGAAADRPRL